MKALIELIPNKPSSVPTRGSQTSTSQIEIVITYLLTSENGGASITEYNIYVDGTKVSSNFKGTRYIHPATSGTSYTVTYSASN